MQKKIIEIIRENIANGELSRYAISKQTGIDQTTLFKIVNGGDCKSHTADMLLDLFGYEITRKTEKDSSALAERPKKHIYARTRGKGGNL
jgi:predicted transcriptional regulator